MSKKFFAAIICVSLILMAATCMARGNFQKIYDERLGMRELAQDEATSETFFTNYGELTFQVRKLRKNGDDKKYHVLVWLGKTRLYESYLPTVAGGYAFRVFKDVSNNNLFLAINSKDRATLSGYSPHLKKYVVYLDSYSYYNEFPASPIFTALKGGDLILAFISQDLKNPYYHAYRFSWDEKNFWFAYIDRGVTEGKLSDHEQP